MKNCLIAITTGLFLLLSNVIFAQDYTTEKLNEANLIFEEGKVLESLALLKKVEAGGNLTKSQEELLYRQMTICYIFLNKDNLLLEESAEKMAQESYIKLLKSNKIYEVKSTDIVDYVRFSKKFTSKPQFLITPHIGFNTSMIDVLEYYGTGNLSDTSFYALNASTPYTPVFTNTTLGLSVNWNFYKKICLEVGSAYSIRSYEYEENLLFGNEPFNLEFRERQQWIDLAARLKVDLGKSKTFIPYLLGGVSYNLLLGSELDLINRSFAELQTNRSVVQARYNNNVSLLGGFGFKWRVFGQHFFTVESQYSRMLRGVNNVDARYSSPVSDILNYELGYVDNDVRFNNIQLTVGFSYAIYKIKMNEITIDD